ncbi:hypothetical protein [Brevundimonas sp. PAMC22021]|uniref:hypothetical protein n=1 Tax=Brevundimonas sp. PAMC22021 TaxID=2861285 RepID=UPI001C6326B5|nr:hypothetical protein [Brevundimonas sp. PAMC22021]QYF87649.1 hypothetical protein KY493_03875 [Brevundimonas sp. PAMC22021]
MTRLFVGLGAAAMGLCLSACDRGETREEAPGRRSADPSANVGGALTGPKPTPQVATPARKPLANQPEHSGDTDQEARRDEKRPAE